MITYLTQSHTKSGPCKDLSGGKCPPTKKTHNSHFKILNMPTASVVNILPNLSIDIHFCKTHSSHLVRKLVTVPPD